MKTALCSFLLFAFLAAVGNAVEPDEILMDEELETRARIISKDLRCLVCRNENIDSSNSELAKDLRILVRERLVLGETNEQTIDFIVGKYGEYVLLRPKLSGFGGILWLLGPVVLLFSFLLVILFIKQNSSKSILQETQKKLTDVEKKQLKEYFDNR